MTRATYALLGEDGTPARALENELTALAGVEPGLLLLAVEFEPATAESIRERGIRPLLMALVDRRDLGALRALVDGASASMAGEDEDGAGIVPTGELGVAALSILARLRAIGALGGRDRLEGVMVLTRDARRQGTLLHRAHRRALPLGRTRPLLGVRGGDRRIGGTCS